MIGDEPFSDMITAQIDAAGNLLYADPALRRLHIKAGGNDGGKMAIPALAEIAMLTHKLKLPLSRKIKVADEGFDIILWIDSEIKDDIAILSILGWNEKSIEQVNRPDGIDLIFNQAEDDICFICNAENQIISFQSSEKNVTAFGEFIGRNVFDVLHIDAVNLDNIKNEFADFKTIENHIVSIASWNEVYEFSAIPRLDDNDMFLGYECYISPIDNISNTNVLDATALAQETVYKGLIASQLAPAIRQPLGRIIANADTIGSKLQGPIRENYANYAKDISNAARHLIEIVDDLGDLEAIERPGFVIADDDIELSDIAERLKGLLALKANEKDIKLYINYQDNETQAIGEFRRVLQIGLNLLTNAVRYSPKGSIINISTGSLGDGVYLSVRDQGPGIDTDKHYKIFEKFERLGRTGDGGSGLGLYISRKLAYAMGGDLVIDSKIGEGACFTLILPKKRGASIDAPIKS